MISMPRVESTPITIGFYKNQWDWGWWASPHENWGVVKVTSKLRQVRNGGHQKIALHQNEKHWPLNPYALKMLVQKPCRDPYLRQLGCSLLTVAPSICVHSIELGASTPRLSHLPELFSLVCSTPSLTISEQFKVRDSKCLGMSK